MDTWLFFPAIALIAGIVTLTPLGTQVLKRGVVFIDLAVARGESYAFRPPDQLQETRHRDLNLLN
jgi:zinc/manganese transport system permease protein